MKHSHGLHLVTSHGLLDLELVLLVHKLLVDLRDSISEFGLQGCLHSLLLHGALSLGLVILVNDSLSDVLLAFHDLAAKVILKSTDLFKDLSLEGIDLSIPVISLN